MQVFAFGMLCALIASAIWLTLATYLELAVSTTHTISECTM
jgi:sodium-dependent phosphate transporter